ncbi:MAG TPA: hypothetical protein VGB94_00200 [Acidobacteriaceae bacterium]
MNFQRKTLTATTLLLLSTLAYASVARSATGQGDTREAAIADAKSSATSRYGDTVTSWDSTTCSSKTIHPNQYDQSVTATQWSCQVDFTTSK